MKRFFTFLLLGLSSLGIICVGAAFALYIVMSDGLPSITKVSDYRAPQVTTVYARDGSVMGYLFREKRFLVNLESMPKYVPNAFLAAEDARFFEHDGIDYKAITRAFITNFRGGGTREGGSTITQQLVKRLLLSPERSYERKFKEAILAYRLENYLTKEQILYLYLNHIYLGNSSYGVEAAARTYFSKHVDQLTVAEAAVLAGLPQAPSRNNPYTQPQNTRERQLWVLGRMLANNFISQAQYDEAIAEKLEYKSMPDPSWTVGSWYLEEVRRQLIAFFEEANVKRLGIALDIYGEDAVYEGGLHVYTAMDPLHQRSSEYALRSGLHTGDHYRGWRGPVEHLEGDARQAFLKNNPFRPADLENAGWVKALVTSVTANGAEVRMGEYKGYISVRYMNWCRTPNAKVRWGWGGRVGNATRVLAPGDVVYVSAVGTKGIMNPTSAPAGPKTPEFKAANITPETTIQLALEQIPDLEGAVASIEVKSGDLVAIAGGFQFSPESQFNRATQALRQPGSSFKPIVYSAALDQGFTPGTTVHDTPFVLPDRVTRRVWTPGNSDGRFLGAIPMGTSLAYSRNVSTIRIAQEVGMNNVIRRAHDLGIPGNIPAVLAVSLGTYEATPQVMAEAFTAFANNGKRIKPRIITAINNCWHEPLVTFEADMRQAISPQNAFIMSYMLKQVITRGTAKGGQALRRPLAGKTGTTNEERDAWFIGYTPHLVTSVYVGLDNHQPIGKSAYGGSVALPIFVKYRKTVEPLYPPDDFRSPGGVAWSGSGYPYIAGIPPRWDTPGAGSSYYGGAAGGGGGGGGGGSGSGGGKAPAETRAKAAAKAKKEADMAVKLIKDEMFF